MRQAAPTSHPWRGARTLTSGVRRCVGCDAPIPRTSEGHHADLCDACNGGVRVGLAPELDGRECGLARELSAGLL
jgi:hypothetical protein